MSKKILIFSLAYYPKYIGGAEVAIKEIADRISTEDVVFDMVTLRFDSSLPKVERVGNVMVYRVGFTKEDASIGELVKFPLVLNKYLFPFLGCWRAMQLHRQKNYDAIWAMMANYAGFAAMFFKLLNPDVKYLLTLQEGDPIAYIKKRVGLTYPIFKKIFTKPDFVQTISHYLEGWARDMGYVGPLEVVPNAVDTKHFSQEFSVEEIGALKEKLGKKNGEQYVITTSRLVTKNAVDIVIRAMKLLPENVKFLVLGIGPDETSLRRLAMDERVENRVMFVGQIDHNELPKYLKVSDIFIRPSRSEGMGNSFIEAMAAGIPVIATEAGGIVDFLFDPIKNPDKEPTGLFVTIDSVEDTARGIFQFLDDGDLRTRCVQNAKTMVMEKYDWNLIANDMRVKVFQKLLRK